MAKSGNHTRLPRNFHKTFKPERRYIAAMLKFAASGNEGDYQQIAAATGIPTGVSSGKVPAILDYCRGMGLVKLSGADRSAIKTPELTPFGRVVMLEDVYLKEPLTQWIAHLNLCSPTTGADVWHQVFFAGFRALGMSFERTRLDKHLSLVYGSEGAGIIGPLVSTYQDEAALGLCNALVEEGGIIRRTSAPTSREWGYGYGAWLLQLMSEHFPKSAQVAVTELDSRAGWRAITGWDISSSSRVLQSAEHAGMIEVDRHMEPWLLRARVDFTDAWRKIYDGLV